MSDSIYKTPEDCVFKLNKNGFLAAVVDGKEHPRVMLSRALPLSAPGSYICISDVEKNEIGIIEDTAVFSAEQRRLIDAELEARYFCPVITEITSVKEKMGNLYVDALIGTFKKSFTVKDVTKSIRQYNGHIDITDIDGNRYRIENLEAIKRKSRRMLEPYLY
ncbi:MAG: DUF1854 domain-containing protein [Clostridia bacterium]|nr:DUF1854 domain-containing protein [Clostridia bacterium]